MFLPEGGWGRLIAESRAGPAAKGDAMIRQCTDADIGAIDSINQSGGKRLSRRHPRRLLARTT